MTTGIYDGRKAQGRLRDSYLDGQSAWHNITRIQTWSTGDLCEKANHDHLPLSARQMMVMMVIPPYINSLGLLFSCTCRLHNESCLQSIVNTSIVMLRANSLIWIEYVPKFLISILPPHSCLSILLFLHAHIRYWWQMDARSPAPSPCLQATGWIFNTVYGLVCTQRRAQRTGGHGDPHNLWIEGGTQYKN